MKLSAPFGRTLFCVALAAALGAAGFVQTNFAQKETPSAAVTKNPLLGRWKSDEAVVEIRANGTISINGDEFRWTTPNPSVGGKSEAVWKRVN